MLKVAKLYEETEQSLIPPSGEVNADDTTDKSLSRASVQPVRVILPKKQVVETQHAEVTVATADATQSLEASESAEEQVLDQIVEEKEIAEEHPLVIPTDGESESPYDTESEIKFIKSFKASTISDSFNIHSEADPAVATNISFMGSGPIDMTLDNVVSSSELSSMPDDDLHYVSAFDTVKSGDDEDMADSEHIVKEGTTDTLFNAFAKYHSLSGHLDYVYEEDSMPTLISNSLQAQLPGLLTDALKECLPSILQDSLPS
ncbi:hypothetical protein Tco_1464261 [Tanacetum coccineum]